MGIQLFQPVLILLDFYHSNWDKNRLTRTCPQYHVLGSPGFVFVLVTYFQGHMWFYLTQWQEPRIIARMFFFLSFILQHSNWCTYYEYIHKSRWKKHLQGFCKPAEYNRSNMRRNVVLKAVVKIQHYTNSVNDKKPVDIATIVAMILEPTTTLTRIRMASKLILQSAKKNINDLGAGYPME